MVCLLLLASALAVNGLYFHISETERKCFIEEVPAETMIVGRQSYVGVYVFDVLIDALLLPYRQVQDPVV